MDFDVNNPSTYDKLSIEELNDVVDYIIASYKMTRDNKNRSGQHLDYSYFIDGKLWLLYLDHSIDSIGNNQLIDCCYTELPEDALLRSNSKISFGESSSVSQGSPNKRKSDEEHENKMKRKLLESKISTLSTFEKKSVLLRKTIVNRRIHEIYDLIGIYEPEVNKISSEMDNLKIVIKERNQSSNENILQYRDLKSVLKIKKNNYVSSKKNWWN